MIATPFALNAGMPMANAGRVVSPVMKANIVLADKEAEARIMAIVDAEPGKTKSAAMCSRMAAENLDRIRGEGPALHDADWPRLGHVDRAQEPGGHGRPRQA